MLLYVFLGCLSEIMPPPYYKLATLAFSCFDQSLPSYPFQLLSQSINLLALSETKNPSLFPVSKVPHDLLILSLGSVGRVAVKHHVQI